MGLQTKAIQQKIKSVNSIRKITKTMEMVSVAKMKKTTERVSRGRAYSRYALEVLHTLAGEKETKHPLFETKKKTGKVLLVVISSNKGLAGSYNINISKALAKYKEKSGNEIDCVTIGKQSEKSARRNKLNIIASFIEFSEKSTSEEFLVIRDMLLKAFASETYETVHILYTAFKSASTYKPFMMQVLPVKERLYRDVLLPHVEEDDFHKMEALALYSFEPSESQVLESVTKQLLGQALFHAFLEALASEHSARMFAMKNANDNAQEMIGDLKLSYNRVRQGAITQEISEIVGGAAAMS